MHSVNNEKGAVLVFITLMIVLLLIMVGMGLDTGQLAYTRSQGQAAVDAAALSAVSGLPMGAAQVTARVAAFNANNDYLSSPSNPIGAANITYVNYDSATGAITDLPNISGANGVRVALEKTNPYTSVAAGTAMKSPVFLTPLMKLFGQSAPGKVDVSVSAVAAIKAIPGIPIAIMPQACYGGNKDSTTTKMGVELTRSPSKTDNSCWTTYWDNPVNAPKIKACLRSASDTCSGNCSEGGVLTDPIFLQNGVVNSTYDDARDAFLINHAPGTCWMVPVVPDATKCNQSDTIQGWASICVTDVTKKGPAGDKYIKANVTCGQGLWRSDSNQCFSTRLIRDTKSGM